MTDWNVTFGNLAIERGLVTREGVQQVYAQLGPGQSLAQALVQRGLLAPQAAAALDAELRATAPSAVTAFATAAPPGPGSGSGSGEARLPREGDVVGGRYQVLTTLGRGGMGAVYRALDGQRNVEVALKVMLPKADVTGNALIRFEREAQAVGHVDDHAGIVKIIDFGLHGLLPYAAMNLVDGQDLKAMVREHGGLDLERALDIGEAVARAVAHCHDKGILHRDLKPANVLIRAEDGRAYVTDFGLALALDQEDADRLTKTGEVLGTPAYMSPEQADGNKELIDERTDVYALGAIVYEAVTGRPPFQGGGLAVLKNVLLDLPPVPSSLREDLPPEIDLILAKAMAKRPEDRYPTAEALADDLRALHQGDPVTVNPPGWYSNLKWRAAHGDRLAMLFRSAIIAAVAATPFLVGWGVYEAHRYNRQRNTEDRIAELLGGIEDLLAKERPLEPKKLGEHLDELLVKERALLGQPPLDPPDPVANRERLTRIAKDPADAALLAEILRAAPPEQQAAFRRAVRRLATAGGEGWLLEERAGLSGEDALLQAATLAGWNAKKAPETIDLAKVLALLDPEAGLGARVIRVRDAAARYLTKGVKASKRVLTGGATGWDELPASPVKNLKHLYTALVREGKAPAVRRAIETLKGEIERKKADKRFWQGRKPYKQILDWAKEASGFLEREPRSAVTASLDWSPVLRALIDNLGPANLRAPGDGLLLESQAMTNIVDLMTTLGTDDEVRKYRKRLANTYLWWLSSALQNRKPVPFEAIVLFPALGMLPSSSIRPLIADAHKRKLFETEVPKSASGDAYLVWAEALDQLVRGRFEGKHEDVYPKYALALGDSLTPAERTKLKLKPEHHVPLRLPMTAEWRPWARYRLAARLLHVAAREKDLARCMAGVDLLRGIRTATFARRGSKIIYLDAYAEWLLQITLQVPGAPREQLQDEALAVAREGEALIRKHHERNLQGKRRGEGNLTFLDPLADPERVEGTWHSLLRSELWIHQQRKTFEPAIARVEEIQELFKKRTRRRLIPLQLQLFRTLIVGLDPKARLWKDKQKEWYREVGELLEEHEGRRPQGRRALQRWLGNHDSACFVLASFEAKRDNLDGVIAALKRARAQNGGRSFIWTDLLPGVMTRLIEADRKQDARLIWKIVDGNASAASSAYDEPLGRLGIVRKTE